MEDLLQNFPAFLLVLVRVSAFFIMMPFFSYRTIPASHRLGLSLFLAWIMYFTIDVPVLELDSVYFLLILKEALVGLFIGFAAFMIMTVVQIAGGFIDFQMGFSIANVIDPQSGTQSPLTGQYLYTIALLLLLSLNGHHLLLDGIFYSYQYVPMDQLFVPFGNQALMEYFVKAFNQTFIVALQMSIPVVGCLFLVDVGLGIVARTVPQFNIFVVGIPVKIIASFMMLLVVMGMMMVVVEHLFDYLLVTLRGLMQLIGGS